MQSTIGYTASVSNSAETPGGCCFQLELIKEEEHCKLGRGGAARPAPAWQLEAGGLVLEVPPPPKNSCTLCPSRPPVQVLTLLTGDRRRFVLLTGGTSLPEAQRVLERRVWPGT